MGQIHSRVENNVVYSMGNSFQSGFGNRIWVGGTFSGDSNDFENGVSVDKRNWKWTTGNTICFDNWGNNEPNNSNESEACIDMSWYGPVQGWNDYDCSKDALIICEHRCVTA